MLEFQKIKNLINASIIENKESNNFFINRKTFNNDSFCFAMWAHFYISPNGKVFPCCNVDIMDPEIDLGNINDSSVEEIMTSEKAINIKKKMLIGEKIKACQSCYKMDEMNIESYRKYFNKTQLYLDNLKHIKEDNALAYHKIIYLDFRFSNKCNFTCRTCDPHYSSSWEKKLEVKVIHKNEENYKNIILNIKENILNDSLKKIYFAGGEPLIMDEHWDLLNFIISNKKTDIELTYSTNLSVLNYKENDFIDLMNKFIKKPTIYVSCDSLGIRGEYIRTGFNHKNFVKNLNLLRDNKINFLITTVLSFFNIYYFKEFILELIDLKFFSDNFLFNIPKENDPFNPYNIPEFILKKFINDLEYLESLDIIKQNKKFLNDMIKIKKDFNNNYKFNDEKFIKRLIRINFLDSKNNLKLKDAMPELYEELNNHFSYNKNFENKHSYKNFLKK